MQTTNKRQFSHSVRWGQFEQLLHCGPYLKSVYETYNLAALTPITSTSTLLNELATRNRIMNVPRFVDQCSFDNDPRYYEQIIAEDKVVPCRLSCWHDFFNGLIWLEFPKTKWLLNRLHMDDISRFGTHPRTPKRNRITHFDECGLVLQVNSEKGMALVDQLAQHQWKTVLHANADVWGKDIKPIIFGHANLEMLLNPFMSLTAKWVVVETASNMDEALASLLIERDCFNLKGCFKPLPLMGIPGWDKNQNSAYYENKQVFRDKKSA